KGSDVALLELAVPSTQPLTPLYFGDGDLAGENALALGWGVSAYDNFPSFLQAVEIPVVTDETGNTAYPDRIVTGTVMFAGTAEGGAGACDFDTGGPLMVMDGGALRLAGVYSWSDGCGEPGKYSAYTRVSAVRAFIEEHVDDIQATSWFPLVGFGGGWETDITIRNTGSETLTGLLRPRDADGNGVSGDKSISLAAGEEATFRVSVDFLNPEQIRYVALHTNGVAMDAASVLSLAGVYSVTLPAASKLDNADLRIPLILSDDQSMTGVALVNTCAAPGTLKIQFDSGDEKTLALNGGAQTFFTIRDLFDGAPRPDLSSAVVLPGEGVVGIMLISRLDAGGEARIVGAVLQGEGAADGGR
ncbi:MAG: trypsin-like serine protease, partial [Desulfobacterales bacterium]|nr:trypsin-like serine protease [Desulfobacterales bacterium]